MSKKITKEKFLEKFGFVEVYFSEYYDGSFMFDKNFDNGTYLIVFVYVDRIPSTLTITPHTPYAVASLSPYSGRLADLYELDCRKSILAEFLDEF